MDAQDALRILLDAVSAGQRKGVYSLQEAARIWEAVLTFTTPPPEQTTPTPAIDDSSDE